VIRGIRSIRDFEYEQDMESMNRHLYPDFEAIMYFARPELSMVSGTLVRDVARCGGPLEGLVTANVGAALRERFRISG
jgi:pantetheine-phosphate adenylyltransferase